MQVKADGKLKKRGQDGRTLMLDIEERRKDKHLSSRKLHYCVVSMQVIEKLFKESVQ